MGFIEQVDQLLGEDPERAVSALKRAYQREPASSEANALIRALLWLEQYDKAEEYVEDAIACNGSHIMSFLFNLGGVSRWCAGKPQEAVTWWRKGLKAKMGDSGGTNVWPALHLLTAAAHDPKLVDLDEVMALLRMKADDRRSRTWPGPISWFLMGKATENEILAQQLESYPQYQYSRIWLLHYYGGIVELLKANPSGYVLKMKTTFLAVLNSRRKPEAFCKYIWHDEFFLARHAVSRSAK